MYYSELKEENNKWNHIYVLGKEAYGRSIIFSSLDAPKTYGKKVSNV